MVDFAAMNFNVITFNIVYMFLTSLKELSVLIVAENQPLWSGLSDQFLLIEILVSNLGFWEIKRLRFRNAGAHYET